MPAICKAGICLTPSFDASQVVPQKKQTRAKANMAFAFVPFLRIVKGLKADKLLIASVDWEMVLWKSNKGMFLVNGEWSMVNGQL